MRKEIKYIQVIALVIASTIYLGLKALPSSEELLQVTRVIDGDTLKLSDGRKVRLIGVDTPELHYSDKLLKDARRDSRGIRTIQEFGRRAKDFTEGLCLGKKVRLEYDVERKDKYGRVLAYVYLEDGVFVNAKILKDGFGQVMTIPPNVRFSGSFLSLQKEARRNKRGFWKEEETLDKSDI